MFRAIKIVGTIVSFLVGSIGTLHRMDKQGQVDPCLLYTSDAADD